MTQRLKDRVALITGASRGLGAAIAKAYAREGAHVILLARTQGGLEETDDAIRAEGYAATLVPMDLTQREEVEKLGPSIAERFKKLDILVGNAGVLGALSPVSHSAPKMWENVFDTNVLANVNLIRALDPLLRASDAGRAIFVTSGMAGDTTPFWSPYASSKAALETIVQAYAEEVAHTNLKVNLVNPGILRTAMRRQAFPGEDASKLPAPESVTQTFVELAMADYTGTGTVIEAAA